MTRLHTLIYRTLVISLLMLASSGCSKPAWEGDMTLSDPWHGGSSANTNRENTEETRKVLILYSAGFNDIKSYLLGDIEELKQGWIPTGRRNDDVILVYSHAAASFSDFTKKTNPHLIRIYRDYDGRVISDTLKTYPKETISASALQLNTVLKEIRKEFKARSYGMIFSSHATGFLPQGYYTDASSYRFNDIRKMAVHPFREPVPTPYVIPEQDPSYPRVKSIGADLEGTGWPYFSYEIEIGEFAEAIPMKMDYILFDACLMGCVEVAYELRERCAMVGFSQAEVLADGLNYTRLAEQLLKKEPSDPRAVCEDYFTQYDMKAGIERSATISLIDTEGMESLAAACAPLFEKYRSGIKSLSKSEVQGFGGAKNYFFDMVDLVRSAGATEAEIMELQKAVDNVIIYKNATEQYYSATDRSAHPIDPAKFSGLTMHFPGRTESELNKYYRTLGWNEATELVEY